MLFIVLVLWLVLGTWAALAMLRMSGLVDKSAEEQEQKP
jgi:hypothetical protein